MKIIFIRHGDPDYENDCLTNEGAQQAQALAEYMKGIHVDNVYSSPFGRAYLTATACYPKEKVVVLDWLKEFYGSPTLQDGTVQCCTWDFFPEYMDEHSYLYDKEKYLHSSELASAGATEKYVDTIAQFDRLLAQHGYQRQGNCYKVTDSNTKTIVCFCHFGLMSVLMSRLMNTSYVLLAQHMCASPSSITTFVSEERQQGVAHFRCLGYGTTPHLVLKNMQNSFSARFCEVFDSDDRH